MKNINNYILEKFKINSDNIKNQYYEFKDENFDEKIKISLPFKIVIPDQQETEEIYKIESLKGGSGKNFWKFFDNKGNLVMGLGKGSIQSLIQRKQRIAIILMSLHGNDYKRTETIYIDKNCL